MKCLVRSMIIIVLFCIAAAIASHFVFFAPRHEWLHERTRIVRLVRTLKADQVSQCIVSWGQGNRERGVHATLRERVDIDKLVNELKAIKVGEKDVEVPWEGDLIIVIIGENTSVHQDKISIQGIGFSNPPPYISPSLRSATLGRVAIEFCRRPKDGKPTVDKRTHP